MKRFSLALTAVAVALITACSAIVSPDISRLSRDAGGTMDATWEGDSGPPRDAGFIDASSPTDTGRPNDAGTQGDGPLGSDAPLPCPGTCDDGIECTVDTCVGGRCVHEADDARCAAGQRCDRTLGCTIVRCTADADCDDGLYCNGAERCSPTAPGHGCIPGPPVACEDGRSCSVDSCDEATDRCVRTLNDAACADAFACTRDRCDPTASSSPDGCVHVPDHGACADSVSCTTDRCDPGASSRTDGCVFVPNDAACDSAFCVTGARCDATLGCTGGTARDCRDGNLCTADSCDESMRMCLHVPRDDDRDGFPAQFVWSGRSRIWCGGPDCNDMNPAINPGAAEVCSNGIDDNCNGATDEGCGGPLGDTCATAIPITLSGGSASITGAIDAFRDDYIADAACDVRSGGRDVVYYFDVTGIRDVRIDTIGSRFDTVLAVGLECSSSGFRAACNDDYGDPRISTESRIWLHRVGSLVGTTRIYVLLDAYNSDSSSGAYTLNVRVTAPAASDTCTAPMDISGGGTVLGFQTNLTGAHQGSCFPSLSRETDAIFSVTGPPSGNLNFRVRSREFNPFVYLRGEPCGSGGELACVAGSAIGGGVNEARLEVGVASGSTNFLFVDNGRTVYTVYYTPR